MGQSQDLFDYLFVLLSIIIGLGIAELLIGTAKFLRTEGEKKLFVPHTAMVLIAFFALLQQWWEAWEFRTVPEWSFPALVLLLAGPILIFLASHIIWPTEFGDCDLEKHYNRNSRKLWTIVAIAVVVATLFRPVMFGDKLFISDNISSLLILIVAVALAIWRNKVLHSILSSAVLISIIVDTMFFNFLISV